MAQQALIIGLGQFGMTLTQALMDKGVEVLAVDKRQNLVDTAAQIATEALIMDATDEDALARLLPQKRDVCVCAIGDESKEGSIICTALLRQMGAPRVIARSGDALHERILLLVGAHEVLNPEKEFGQRLASRIAFPQIVSDMPLGDGFFMTEIATPKEYIGKTLIDLALPKRFEVMVVAIRRGKPSGITRPIPNEPLRYDDNLIVVSTRSAITALLGS